MSGQKLIGVRSLIAIMWGIGAIVLVAKIAPDTLASVCTAIVAILGLLFGHKKLEQSNGNGGDNV